jgi:hypothetical protein
MDEDQQVTTWVGQAVDGLLAESALLEVSAVGSDGATIPVV